MDLGLNWRGPEDALSRHPTQKDMYIRSSVIMKYSAGMPISEYKGYYMTEELGGQRYTDDIVV